MLLAMLDSMETLPQLRFLAVTEVFSARVDIAQQRENRCRLPTPVLHFRGLCSFPGACIASEDYR